MKIYILRLSKFLYRKTFFKIYRYIKNKVLSKKLQNDTFSIISSNCIGGLISSDLGISYKSPTVGLFFNAPCFIKFCENIEYYLKLDLEFISHSKYKEYQNVNYPIGLLDDVEIHFLHYSTDVEAQKKWEKRKKRVNFNNIYFIMTDRDSFSDELAHRFNSIPYKNKILFSSSEREIESNIFCSEFFSLSCVPSDFPTYRSYEKYFNVVSWLNEK